MSILIRQSVSRDGSRAYNDTELEAHDVSFGSAPDNTVILSGPKVAPQHARLLPGLRRLHVECFDNNRIEFDGRFRRRRRLLPGDEFSIGGHRIEILPPPPGFRMALLVEPSSSDEAGDLESSYLTSIEQTRIGIRGPAWLLALLVLALGLALPYFLSTTEQEPLARNLPVPPEYFWLTGPLHPSHRLATDGDCSHCHQRNFERAPDSACQACHESTGDHAMPAAMAEAGHRQEKCGSCHAEHEGRDFLINTSGNECQTCHEASSLADDHPGFSNYPNPVRPQIIFDHARHQQKHFAETDKRFSCHSCHSLDSGGDHQTIGTFEAMCVDCHSLGDAAQLVASKVFHHGDQIIASDPVTVFTLPRVDLKTLDEQSGVGHWPEGTRKGSRKGITRLGLTPMTEFLLMLDGRTAPALARLKQHKIRLSSLKKASEQEITDVLTVLWGCKQLLADLAANPASALAGRIEPVLQRPLLGRERAALSGQLPAPLLADIVRNWFDSEQSDPLQLDLVKSPLSDSFEAPPTNPLARPGVSWVLTGQWEENKYALNYRASGHSDAFLKAWIELSLRLAQTAIDGEQNAFGLQSASVQLFDALTDSGAEGGQAKGPGRCSKCHSQVADSSGLIQISWQSLGHPSLLREHTQFSHLQHLGGADQEACNTCHKIDAEAAVLAAYNPNATQAAFVSNFSQVSEQVCAGCHGPKLQASDTCITCHNYHVSPQLSDRDKGGADSPLTQIKIAEIELADSPQ